MIFNRKYIIWDLGKDYADFISTLQRRVYMKFYKFILIHSFLIYGYNSRSKAYFKKLGIEESKLVILNNTIDTRKIRSLKSDYVSEVPNELSEQSEGEYIFFIYVGT